MAGLIAMIAVFVVVTIEMTFSTMNGSSLGGCHGGHNGGIPGYQPVLHEEDESGPENVGAGGGGLGNEYANGSAARAQITVANGSDAMSGIPGRKTRHRRSGSIARELRRIERFAPPPLRPATPANYLVGTTSPWTSSSQGPSQSLTPTARNLAPTETTRGKDLSSTTPRLQSCLPPRAAPPPLYQSSPRSSQPQEFAIRGRTRTQAVVVMVLAEGG